MEQSLIAILKANWFTTWSRATGLILSGIVLLIFTYSVSAGLAPAIGVTDTMTKDRVTLVGSQGGGPGWHEYGSVYRLNGTETIWREASADSYFDVTKTPNGTILAGFMESGYSACGPYNSPCTRTGFRVINPQPTPRVISEYSFPVRTKKNSEVHDVEALSTGEYLLTDMEYERIFTVRNGTVTWQWNGSSFYDAPADPTKTDWLHINDVDVIDEDRYLVSVRNANQLLIIERGNGVVDVINEDERGSNDGSCRRSGQLSDTDGDDEIRCGDPAVLNHQHNPQWLNETAILVADSENDRVVELHKNATTDKWEPAWALRRAGGIAFSWPRDADRLPNGNTLITDTLNKRIIEVTESGAVVWGIKTPKIPYEADRIPFGESANGQPYITQHEVNDAENGSTSVLTLLLRGLRAIFPALPYWFGKIQLILTVIGLGLVGGGFASHGRNHVS